MSFKHCDCVILRISRSKGHFEFDFGSLFSVMNSQCGFWLVDVVPTHDFLGFCERCNHLKSHRFKGEMGCQGIYG